MKKVRWWADVQLSTQAMRSEFPECAKILVRLKDDRVIEGFRPLATGMPAVPLTDEGLTDKFRSCLSFAGTSQDRADMLAETLLNISSLPNQYAFAEVVQELWGRPVGTQH